jgi:NTE family protein
VAARWTWNWLPHGEHRASESASEATQTVFILLGGAARGAAQAGALTVLMEHGIIPDLIIGISAGAWNGAYLAADPTPERAHELEAHWRATSSQEALGHHWRAALNVIGKRISVYSGDGVRRMAERYLAGATFEQLHIPLTVVATDLVSGDAVFFTSGALDRAVLASSAIPAIFPPLVEGERILVDGGWAEWSGCLAALQTGAPRLVLVGCGSVHAAASKWQTFRHIWERSFDVSARQNFERTLFALRGTNREILAVFPELPAGTALDFDRAPALIRAGRIAAERAVEEWEQAHGVLPQRVSPQHVSRVALEKSSA